MPLSLERKVRNRLWRRVKEVSDKQEALLVPTILQGGHRVEYFFQCADELASVLYIAKPGAVVRMTPARRVIPNENVIMVTRLTSADKPYEFKITKPNDEGTMEWRHYRFRHIGLP